MGCSEQYRFPLIIVYPACRRCSPCKDRSFLVFSSGLYFLCRVLFSVIDKICSVIFFSADFSVLYS